MLILLRWLLSTLAILITAYLLPGIQIIGFFAALVAALVLGIINTFIRPVFLFLTFPITIVTLGLFTLVVNALLVLLVSTIVSGFHVENFWWAVLFSIILTIVSYVLNKIASPQRRFQ